MGVDDSEIHELLRGVTAGQAGAADALLARYRTRLGAMVRLHMQPGVAARFDPSDVVQEALAEAYRKLPAYADQPDVPFYVWLRSIAWERRASPDPSRVSREPEGYTLEPVPRPLWKEF